MGDCMRVRGNHGSLTGILTWMPVLRNAKPARNFFNFVLAKPSARPMSSFFGWLHVHCRASLFIGRLAAYDYDRALL